MRRRSHSETVAKQQLCPRVLAPDALCSRLKATGQRSNAKWKQTEGVPLPSPPPSACPSLSWWACLRVLPGGRPEAHNGPLVLHLLQVTQADVLVQLNHFVHPENVRHPVIRADDDVEVVLQLPLLWVDKARQDSASERHTLRVTGERRPSQF